MSAVVGQPGASQKGRAKKKGGGGNSGDRQLSEMTSALSIKDSGNQQSVSLFPRKPERKGPAPGKIVALITNLFRMSISQNKPIYRYTVEVDLEEDQTQTQKATETSQSANKGGDRIPRKLSKEIRRLAVGEAIKTWIEKNRPSDYKRDLKFNYLFDANASNMYALFNMFAKVNAKTQEFRVECKLETFQGKEVALVPRLFRVKVYQGSILNLQGLVQFCAKNSTTREIADVQELIRAIDVIMRGQIVTLPSYVLTTTSVFPFKRENQFKVSTGVIASKGYSMSARPTECGLVLNVANTVAAFHEEIALTDLLRDRFSVRDLRRPLTADVLDRLKREIRNKQVEARHHNYGTKQKPHYRKYRVNDVSGSSKDKFTWVDKSTKETRLVTIQEYFKKEYPHVNLQYPDLPCIIDKGRKLPLEFCHLIDKQRVLRKMEPDETSVIIKESAVPPTRHFAQITNHVAEIKKFSQPMEDFGIQFDPKPIEVTGRELPPISLIGGSKMDIRPSDGQYNVQRDRFFKPARLTKWVLAFIVDEDVRRDQQRNGPNNLFEKRFSELYCRGGQSKGVSVPPMAACDSIPANREDEFKAILKKYYRHLNSSKVDHAIIVLPKRCPDWVYRYLQYLEVSAQEGRKPGENWTRTSCLKYENYVRKIIQDRDDGRMFIANLWLKYNTKLGGINFVLKDDRTNDFLQDGYIFISIDVCHPAPGDKLIQSVAATVAMWDLTNPNMSYCTRTRVQRKTRDNQSTIEEVGEIGQMLEELLDSYFEKKRKLPTKIVTLRDGVSEGQFKIVLDFELGKVKSVISQKYTKARMKLPLLSCLVVQKRHKVRFMRKEPHQGRKGPDYNIQPGTVVDSEVTHPRDFSFYIAPHKAIQGTSRTAHIYMIYDEINFSQDQAQAMVHALSYLSPRCTKSTSIPTPVNLADLAAERGKNIVISWNDENRHKMDENERLTKINAFLSNMADKNYKNTLYYV